MNLRAGMRRMRVVVWLFLSIAVVPWLFALYVGHSPQSVVWLPILGFVGVVFAVMFWVLDGFNQE